MAIRDDGSYPRMDKLLHEVPTRDAKGDNALPLGELLLPSDGFCLIRAMRRPRYNHRCMYVGMCFCGCTLLLSVCRSR